MHGFAAGLGLRACHLGRAQAESLCQTCPPEPIPGAPPPSQCPDQRLGPTCGGGGGRRVPQSQSNRAATRAQISDSAGRVPRCPGTSRPPSKGLCRRAPPPTPAVSDRCPCLPAPHGPCRCWALPACPHSPCRRASSAWRWCRRSPSRRQTCMMAGSGCPAPGNP